MITDIGRYIHKGVNVYDTFEQKEVCLTASIEDAKDLTLLLNNLFNQYHDCIDKQIKISEELKEKDEYISTIMNVVDLRIQENRQLARIHFHTPEDDYINEYESRAYELEQLKEQIKL